MSMQLPKNITKNLGRN